MSSSRPRGFADWDDWDWVRTSSSIRTAAPPGSGSSGTRTQDDQDWLHLDIHASGGRAVPLELRRQWVDAEARRLAGLGATIAAVLFEEGIDHYGVAMRDPEGNEFDIN
jgi:glyoxalase superfamily protein